MGRNTGGIRTGWVTEFPPVRGKRAYIVIGTRVSSL